MIHLKKDIKKSAGQVVAETVLGKAEARKVFRAIQKNRIRIPWMSRKNAVKVGTDPPFYVKRFTAKRYYTWAPDDRGHYRLRWFHEDYSRVSDSQVLWFILGFLCLRLKPRSTACQHLHLQQLQRDLRKENRHVQS